MHHRPVQCFREAQPFIHRVARREFVRRLANIGEAVRRLFDAPRQQLDLRVHGVPLAVNGYSVGAWRAMPLQTFMRESRFTVTYCRRAESAAAHPASRS